MTQIQKGVSGSGLSLMVLSISFKNKGIYFVELAFSNPCHGFAAQSIVWSDREWQFLRTLSPIPWTYIQKLGGYNWLDDPKLQRQVSLEQKMQTYDGHSGLCNLARGNIRIFHDKGQNLCNVLHESKFGLIIFCPNEPSCIYKLSL